MKTLSKSGISDTSTIEAWHVSQSVDAFKGLEAYQIRISGSLILEDGTQMQGTASRAISSSHSDYSDVANVASSSLQLYQVPVYNDATVTPYNMKIVVGKFTVPPSSTNAISQSIQGLENRSMGIDAFGHATYIEPTNTTSSLSMEIKNINELTIETNEGNLEADVMWTVFYY